MLMLLVACSKKDASINDPLDPSRPLEISNTSYGSRPRQQADIYLPANRNASSTKTIILLHGGAWTAGDKADLSPLLPQFKAALPEAALVRMNYTLVDGTAATIHPAQMNDITALLKYLENNRQAWNLSGSWTLLGVSAGGHLSLLYAYAHDSSRQVKAVASIVGPTDITDPFYTTTPFFQSLFTTFLGKSYAQDPGLYVQLSPALQVKAGAPPTYLAYGGLDPLVPVSNPTLLENRLKSLNIPYQYNYFPQEGHEFSPAATSTTLDAFARFWRQQVK
ncbi:MAG: alpha/beta hydrolase [Chitinophagaceae bacterium]|jgi:acetyl esterase/lipase|nr:alpha/beta hydrolase [Chitinophagaceae bacterium]